MTVSTATKVTDGNISHQETGNWLLMVLNQDETQCQQLANITVGLAEDEREECVLGAGSWPDGHQQGCDSTVCVCVLA